MIRLLDLFRSVPSLSATLSGGRAPAYWRRDVSRLSQSLAEVYRASGWVDELDNVRLQLCDRPLLGHSLTALTNESTDPQAPPENPLPLSIAGPKPQPKSRRPHRQNAPHINAGDRSRTRLFGTSDPMLSPTQKSSITIEPLSTVPLSTDSPPLSRPLGEASEGAAVSGATQAPGCQDVPSCPVGRTTTARPWSYAAARRTRKLVLQNWVNWRYKAPGVSTDEPDFEIETPLAGQLSISLEGPSAPAQLLMQLAALPVESGKKPIRNEEARPGTVTAPPNNGSDATAQGRRTPSTRVLDGEHHRYTTRAGTAKYERGIEHSSGSPLGAFRPALPLAGVRQSVVTRNLAAPDPFSRLEIQLANEDESSSSWPRTALPVLTPGLPELLPPAAPGALPIPVAAATARISARKSEEASQAEDLNILAAQITRILNEEARRHGIDV